MVIFHRKSNLQRGVDKTMLRFILYLFLIAYFARIILRVYKILQICKCIHKLRDFIRCQEIDTYETLLEYSPVIQKYAYCRKISYQNDLKSNLNNSKFILEELLDCKASQKHDLKRNFNPLYTLEAIFEIPCCLLYRLGLKRRRGNETLINVLLWLLVTVSNLLINSEGLKQKATLLVEQLIDKWQG